MSFGLQHVDYTQWKTKSKARKVTEILVVFRHFCQKACPGYHIYAKLKIINAYFVAARCHEFIEKLPEGYQTRLSEGGNTLSGGEKQRIAIARAILKNAPILLLDESTASLDADNEAKINQALDRLMKGKTVFVIAHRLNTIQNADQIILLNQGRIEEMGTHTELLAKKGHYYEMVQEQEKAKKWIVNGA